jgi:tetratricopeptide (TPR) repeat protein
MGKVYRATDTNLKRSVAIKVLPDVLGSDAEQLARFQREAEVLARLNHPNIAQIYGLEKSDGTTALVMELVEGPTLADRIAQGAIPPDECLQIAKQIAGALESAHALGIVHRDLKPANIKMRPDGTVKVLDFGLAKALESPGAAVADASASPTITSPEMSQVGLIVGTPAYMSPEQARARPVDRRADIWAFGCVLYEMLTGRSPFRGETVSDTIARVLEREPDWRALPSSTPRRLRELLRNCLQKDQHHRLHEIADARIIIDRAQSGRSRSKPVVKGLAVAGGITVALTLLVGAWWYRGRSIPPIQHAPVSVIIADIQNATNDPIFNGTLEPVLRIVLEGADFISAYDRTRIRSTFGVTPPENLDETAAREIAVKQGLGVVLATSISQSGNGFEISIKALRTVTGNAITEEKGRAASKDEVLNIVTRLLTSARRALGDQMSEFDQLFAMRTISTTSLEVVSNYAAAMGSQSSGRYEDARQSLLQAIELDSKFGLGYQALAALSRNLGRLEDAHRYINQAFRYLDGMTERERFVTRGLYYRLTGDYQQCAKEYGEMTARYTGDAIAYNQRALCSSKLRDLSQAVAEVRLALQIFPNHPVFRGNLAVYSAYAGNFAVAEREARTVQPASDLALLAVGFAQLGQGLLPEATQTFEKLAALGTRGKSWSASALADLAMYEGRFSDAGRLFEQGADADLATRHFDRAARKLTSLAHTHLLRERPDAAIAAAEKALGTSKATEVRFLASRILVESGAVDKGRPIATELASELAAEPHAYGKIIEAKIAQKHGDPREAIRMLIEANGILDTWLGHFELGRAYLEVGAFPQADSEFDRCIKRRGEALSLFLDEEPTYGYFPAAHYYQGRAREGLNSEGFGASYRSYLSIRGKSSEDPLVPLARPRAGL